MDKPIIAITGSAGKTMVKTMIAAVLSEKWVIFESKDYYNTFQHSQKHADQIGYIHRAAVLEYGMAFAGAITQHCSYVMPNISVITNVLTSHIGNFNGDISKLIKAKSELIHGMKQNGILFLNADDKNSKSLELKRFNGKIITVGIDQKSKYMAKQIIHGATTTTFSVLINHKNHAFVIPTIGLHNVYNALFAIAVADHLGFSADIIKVAFMKMKKPNHRLNILQLKDGIKVIDDTVHASPDAMKAALDVLKKSAGAKKIAVLGTMTELGPNSKVYHHDVGKYLASSKIDHLFTFGGYSVNIGRGAIDFGYSNQNVMHFKEAQIESLYKELKHKIRANDVVLIKGASGLNMFQIVRFLKKEYKK